ncbi:MAG: CpXC domain-containing protein [Clostridia bacterium]|nr:CpXC domain-containing protein [Clostridia bacterium]
MAEKIEITISCPKCNFSQTKNIYKSINASTDGEIKDLILNRELFTFTCDNCDHKALIDYDFLYHDPENKVMIYFLKDYDEKEDNLYRNIPKPSEDYKMRIVKSASDLIEKIKIFDMGFDDRVIELCKLFYLGNMRETNPEFITDHIYYDTDKNLVNSVFVFMNKEGKPAVAGLDKDFYNQVFKMYEERIIKREKSSFEIIDKTWAESFINKK